MTGGLLGPRQDEPHFVYELIGPDGKHLYVGCTYNLGQRLNHHRSAKDWYGEVIRVEASLYPNQRAALDVERELIELYDPQHNTVFTDRYDTGGWDSRRKRMAEKHAAGQFCHDSSCGACKKSAHDQGVTCDATGTCGICRKFPPWYSLMTAEERRRHPDWEPLWEDFLDHVPNYDELTEWFDRNDEGWRDRMRPAGGPRRRSA